MSKQCYCRQCKTEVTTGDGLPHCECTQLYQLGQDTGAYPAYWMPVLTKGHWRVLHLLSSAWHNGAGYLAIWHIAKATGIAGSCGCPGPLADILDDLTAWNWIRELPDLDCRYEIVVAESEASDA